MIMLMETRLMAGEISAHKLTHVDRETSVLEASKLMRKSGTTELLVTDQAGGVLLPLGIVTANDIVTRVIAAELDPAVLTTGDIAWSGIDAKEAGDGIPERRRSSPQNHAEALAVMDGDGCLVGTVRLDEFMDSGAYPAARPTDAGEDRPAPNAGMKIVLT